MNLLQPTRIRSLLSRLQKEVIGVHQDAMFVVTSRTMATKSGESGGITNKDQHSLKEKLKDQDKSSFDEVRHDPNWGGVGFKPDKRLRDVYLNPLLTPPPRSPSSQEDFNNPSKLGHWVPFGFDYTDKLRDTYQFHELLFYFCTCGFICTWLWSYAPDLKDREWARREAFLRTHKREALGLPLIDPNVVDPDRIVLPTEGELGDYFVSQ